MNSTKGKQRMTESIIIAVISLVGVIITGYTTVNKVTQELHTQNEVQNVKIDNLAQEVKKHNDFATRIPVIEGELKLLSEKIKVANNRIADLEHTAKN